MWEKNKSSLYPHMDKNIPSNGNILIYQSEDGTTHIDVRMEEETIWLTQQQLCDLYQTSKSNVSEHIKHIFEEGELSEFSVVRKFRTTASDGKSYEVSYYNLDMIISLGYRIRSIIATRFRQWATKRINEYIVKGFTIDDERLKNLGGGNSSKNSGRVGALLRPAAVLNNQTGQCEAEDARNVADGAVGLLAGKMGVARGGGIRGHGLVLEGRLLAVHTQELACGEAFGPLEAVA